MKQSTLSDQLISDTLHPYDVVSSPELCDSIRAYIDLLLRWNQKIALTTITDPIEILRLHFGESMFAIEAVPIRHGRLADIGTGAGFPAIPIRMVKSDLDCVLIESNHKKATFLAEIVRTLQLSRVEIFRGRMEDYPESAPQFEFVISRALGMHQAFLKWSLERLRPKGNVIFWIGEADSAKIATHLTFEWRQIVKIPNSDRRALLIGTKIPQE
ncbi:MAG TPA: 16S rRNA (guanine(527)-N(7))-methyltransferase RsmG [Candidatus Acidoferrales bacterium]